MSGYLQGLREAEQKLAQVISKIERGTKDGLVTAGLLILGEAKKQTPVVTGNLRSSGYIVAKGRAVPIISFASTPKFVGKCASKWASFYTSRVGEHQSEVNTASDFQVHVGFAVVYAARVHELPTAGAVDLERKARMYPSGSYSVVGKWKFLEDPIKDNFKAIEALVVEGARTGAGK